MINTIKSVKIQGQGYTLNGTMHVPGNAPGNKEYELIKQWLSEGNTPEPEFTEEELAKQELDRQRAEDNARRKQAMLDGLEYNGYIVSLTKDDGDGLAQVKNGFDLGLTDTVIHFENGIKMPITSDEFQEFALWFVNERNKFFGAK